MMLTVKLLLNLSVAVLFGVCLGFLCRRALELGGLVLDLALENGDVLSQGFLRGICAAGLALEAGYPRPHLLVLNLPGVSISLVTVPFCLQKSHDTLQGVFCSLGNVWAVLHRRPRLHAAEAISNVGAHHGAPDVQLGELIEERRPKTRRRRVEMVSRRGMSRDQSVCSVCCRCTDQSVDLQRRKEQMNETLDSRWSEAR